MAQRQTTQKYASNSYDRYLQSGYYSYSSQAHQLEEVEEEYREYARPKRRPAPARKTKGKNVRRAKVQRGTPKPKTVYELDLQNRRVFSPTTFLLVAVFFLGVFAWLISMAYADQTRFTLSSAQNTLKTIQQENTVLEKDLYEGYDLVEIEQIATTRLNMTKPEEYQLVVVNVPRASYSVQYEDVPETQSSGFNLAALLQ